MSVKVTVSGLRELEEALRRLPDATAKGVLRRVGVNALTPVAEKARANAPQGPTGNLKRGTVVSTKLSRRQQRLMRKQNKDDVQVYAGVGRARHSHLIEFGTRERFHKSGKSVGRGPRKPFLEPAWDSQKMQVLETIKRELGDEINKAAQRLARKAAKGK